MWSVNVRMVRLATCWTAAATARRAGWGRTALTVARRAASATTVRRPATV